MSGLLASTGRRRARAVGLRAKGAQLLLFVLVVLLLLLAVVVVVVVGLILLILFVLLLLVVVVVVAVHIPVAELTSRRWRCIIYVYEC